MERRECNELKILSAVTPSDEETDSALSPAKRSTTPILKEVSSNSQINLNTNWINLTFVLNITLTALYQKIQKQAWYI